jgi:cellulose synthase/poly-beta-1,6-N-acetylglucosamine synthase-like glycosyltransferase
LKPARAIRTSVVVPAYESWATLPRTLEALRRETDRPDRELLLVESSGSVDAEELERRWPWARILAPPARMLPGAARNLALEYVRGELVAFTDADAVPEPGWLDALEAGLTPEVEAVAGAIVNGTPESAAGTSGFLLEFTEWMPERNGAPRHAATCNLLVRRRALEHAGGFPEDMWPGEDTVFTFRLAALGSLRFAPAARVRHLNRTRLAEVFVHQFRLGQSFSEVCRRVQFPGRGLARLPFAPLLGVARVPKLWLRLSRWRSLPRRHLALLPLVVLGASVWTLGVTWDAFRSAFGHRSERRKLVVARDADHRRVA